MVDRTKATLPDGNTVANSTTNTSGGKQKHTFPIVAIGASAGGLEALEAFFTHMPPDVHIAFIIIMHLDPHHSSILPELLQRYTKMPAHFIDSGAMVEPDRIYVLPPGKNALIEQGILRLLEQEGEETSRLAIDYFVRSLANDQRMRAVLIILSGAGNDGTTALRSIREKGGLIIVQDIKTAHYDSMPKSAINTGLVDYILPPEKMPECLLKYKNYPIDRNITLDDRISDEIQQILTLLRKHIGHDFSLYKQNTIFRRIQKRMNIQQIDNISTYSRYLQQHPHEFDILFKELLINVTSFFRDPEAFNALKHELISRVLKDKPKDYNLRIWVPGCSTGEEAYSIAIILQECMVILNRYFNVQIFGTDIDDDAIEVARGGLYSENITIEVSSERLAQFFSKEEKSYRISKDIRKMIIFATQNIIKDPPFTKLDLLSCRNLMIYLNSQLQKKLLPLFHYSLQPNGLLFLGSSETIGNSVELFNIIDRKHKIFEHKSGTPSFQAIINFPTSQNLAEVQENPMTGKTMPIHEPKLSQLIDKILLEHYAPACVIVDEKDNVIYIHGKTGKYLEFATGEARLNVVDMSRPELKTKVAAAIRKVNITNKQVVYSGLQLKHEQSFRYVNLKVMPMQEPDSLRRLLIIIFEDMITFEQATILKGRRGTKSELDKRVAQLEQELKYTKESLQITIEELETSNEELKSSNEELQSTNEELQSTNEEIETSKEELQSLNEELTTVNAELESRIEQLSSANDDIKNLLDNTEIATIFLDKNLCIKRFTPKATGIVHLIMADLGRPVNHIVSNLKYDRLVEDAKNVLKSLVSKTTEVQDKNGRWYVVRIIPYRTVTNIIDGVVITFLNIHAQKQVEEERARLAISLTEAQTINEALINNFAEPSILLDKQFKIMAYNEALRKLYNSSAEHILGQSVDVIIDQGAKNKTKSKEIFEEKINQQSVVDNIVIQQLIPGLGEKHLTLRLQKLTAHASLLLITSIT